MIKQESKKNKTSFVILPMLGENRDYFDWKGAFINCFTKADISQADNHLYLKYDYSGLSSEKINKLERQLCKDLNGSKFVDLHDPQPEETIFIYSLNKKYLTNYDLFLQGKYSKIEPWYKEEIIRFHSGTDVKGLVSVLNRDINMLHNLNRHLGCTAIGGCSCKSDSNREAYRVCNKFSDFGFDFKTAECWGALDEKEFLNTKV